MRKKPILLATIICAAALLATLLPALYRSNADRSVADADQSVQPSLEIEEEGEAADRREPQAKESQELLRGRVLSTNGHVIPGAKVAWIALEKQDTEPDSSGPAADWGIRARSALEARTDQNGRFWFADLPSSIALGSVVVVTEPHHLANGIELSSDRDGWSSGLDITLEPADPVTARVVDAKGRNQDGALVSHVARARSPAHNEQGVPMWERFFAEEVLTDAQGLARLTPFRHEQAFWATKGNLMSRPWHGSPSAEVVLQLGESFTIGGTVVLPSWDPAYAGERRILVSGCKGNLCRPLVLIRDVHEGSWGPVRVPLDADARYTVRLEGAPVLPIEEAFDAPSPSAHKRIDFVASKGEGLYLFVQDEEQEPVTTAKAVVRWGGLNSASGANEVSGVSRSDGYLYVGAVPNGTVMFEVMAPGYGRVFGHGNIPSNETYLVVLPRAGRVTGHCLRDGEPVSDFEVIFRNDGTITYNRRLAFFDREDGSFEVENLSPGTWTFMAADPAHPGGKPLSVVVDANSEARIELLLPPAIRGAGRIVDAVTGEGVCAAAIQVYSSGGLERAGPWGEPTLSAADGTFELDAFVLGSNYVSIEAEGYAWREVKAEATDNSFLDWGDIRLERPQALRLSLVGIDQLHGVRLEDLSVSTVEGFILPSRKFTPEGTVLFEEVPPGDHLLLITYPDTSFARLHLQLESGKDWTFDHKIAGDRILTVHVLDPGGDPISSVSQVVVTAQEVTGVFVVRMKGTADGIASFEGIRADTLQIHVLDKGNEIVASRTVEFGGGSTLESKMRIGESPLRVRIVDPDGEPLANAWITLRSADGSEILGFDDTAVDGWAEVVGLPETTLLMDVNHGIRGTSQGVPIDASVKEQEFVLDAKGSLELVLRDGEVPLAGVITQVQTTGGVTLRAPKDTDDQGSVRYESLGKGRYHIACRRVDCWPIVVDRDLGPDEHATELVQMRRLASLALTALSADGLLVSGVDVELSSSEFGVGVGTWLAEKRVRSSTGLRTDNRGRVQIEGLPRGTYLWSVQFDGEVLTGAVNLEPGKMNEVPIRLVK